MRPKYLISSSGFGILDFKTFNFLFRRYAMTSFKVISIFVISYTVMVRNIIADSTLHYINLIIDI